MRSPGARVGPRQRPTAQLAVSLHPSRNHRLDLCGALPVPELPQVEVPRAPSNPRTRTQPRKMSLAVCISRWPTTTRCAQFAYSLAPDELLQHRRACLLGLQEQRVIRVVAQQQRDVGAGSDAADPDHLAREVDQTKLVEEHAGGRARGWCGTSRASCAGSAPSWRDPRHRPRGHEAGRSSGGSATILGRPSAIPAKRSSAPRLSLVCAFPRARASFLRPAFSAPREPRPYGGLVDVGIPDVRPPARRTRASPCGTRRPRPGRSCAIPSPRTRWPARRSPGWSRGA